MAVSDLFVAFLVAAFAGFSEEQMQKVRLG